MYNCYFCVLDSYHLAISENSLDQCVNPKQRQEWNANYDHYFGDKNLCGQLILENVCKGGYYWGEKAYRLDCQDGTEIIKFKGVPHRMYDQISQQELSTHTCVSYNQFKCDSNYGIVLNHFSRILKNALIPKKRYFFNALQSKPLF